MKSLRNLITNKLAILFICVTLLTGCALCTPYVKPVVSKENIHNIYQVKVLDRDIYIEQINAGISCKY